MHETGETYRYDKLDYDLNESKLVRMYMPTKSWLIQHDIFISFNNNFFTQPR